MKSFKLLPILLCLFLLFGCFSPNPPIDIPAETPDDALDDTPADTPDDAPDDTPADTPDDAPDNVPSDVPDNIPDDVPDDTDGFYDKELKVHFLDVGQGDCAFIELPDGTNMLIDASVNEQGDKIVAYLKKEGCKQIDVLVATHPHDDHIGGMVKVIESFDIGKIYMPKKSHTTDTFESLLLAIQNKGLSINTAVAGKYIIEKEELSALILSPYDKEYDGLNNYSVCIKLCYKDRSFLFTGDAESAVEKDLISSPFASVKVDVCKVGHHGSNTSSRADFVAAANAKFAVISVGADNDYGHPKEEIVKRWANSGATVLRTDLLGDIVFVSDGTSLSYSFSKTEGSVPDETPEEPVVPEDPVPTALWILNTSTKKIHYPHCSSASNIAEKNRGESTKTVQQLISEGYSPCGNCDPHD